MRDNVSICSRCHLCESGSDNRHILKLRDKYANNFVNGT